MKKRDPKVDEVIYKVFRILEDEGNRPGSDLMTTRRVREQIKEEFWW